MKTRVKYIRKQTCLAHNSIELEISTSKLKNIPFITNPLQFEVEQECQLAYITFNFPDVREPLAEVT